MKIAASSSTKPSKKVDYIIPLGDDESHHKLTKANSVSWELRTVPADADSPTYKYLARILTGDESVRQMLRWSKDLTKLCTGLNATTLQTMKPIMVACMRPRVETIFEAALTNSAQAAYNEALKAARAADRAAGAGTTVNETAVTNNGVNHYRSVDHLVIATRMVLFNLMPAKVLAKVKRQVRRDMRKPVDMKVRAYFQNLTRINEEEIPCLPPFGVNQALTPDELLDILLHGTPRSWQNEMDRQGFDPIVKGYHATVDFMENLEGLEEKPSASDNNSGSKTKKKSSSKEKGTDGAKKPPYFCELHGANWTHNSSDCRAMKSNEKRGSYNNKTWKRKADDSANQSKKELAALVTKTVKEGVQKELASLGKKRKSKSNDKEEGECALVDILDSNLDGFNYDDMDDMSVKSEVSC